VTERHYTISLPTLAPSLCMGERALLSDAVTLSRASNMSWASWSSNPEDIADRPPLGATPDTSEYNPWVVNPEDTQNEIDAGAEKLSDTVSLPWLMGKEYSSTFLLHHAVLKVSARFMGGRLHKRYVSTACPDPFCGAAIQHYHIPAKDLSPAQPRRKNQQVFVLSGEYRGRIFTVTRCNMKKNTVEVATSPTTYITLAFELICLVEQSQHIMPRTLQRIREKKYPGESEQGRYSSSHLYLYSITLSVSSDPALFTQFLPTSSLRCSVVVKWNYLHLPVGVWSEGSWKLQVNLCDIACNENALSQTRLRGLYMRVLACVPCAKVGSRFGSDGALERIKSHLTYY
ncbi:hypothetical protein CY34DRAFT_110971, partial [Suillus luteus UH-Slu-Lm8-n1]